MAETIRAIVTPLSADYPPRPGAFQDGRALRPRCVDTHHRDGLTFGAGKRRRGDLRRCHSYLSQRYRLPIPCVLSRALRRMRAQPAAVDRAWSIFVTLSVKESPAVRRPSLRSMTRARTCAGLGIVQFRKQGHFSCRNRVLPRDAGCSCVRRIHIEVDNLNLDPKHVRAHLIDHLVAALALQLLDELFVDNLRYGRPDVLALFGTELDPATRHRRIPILAERDVDGFEFEPVVACEGGAWPRVRKVRRH